MRGRRPRRERQFEVDPSPQPRTRCNRADASLQIRREREGSIARHRMIGETQRGQGESCQYLPRHAAHLLPNRLKTSPVLAATLRFATNATSPRRHSFIASSAKNSSPSWHARDQPAPRSLASSSARSAPTSSSASWLILASFACSLLVHCDACGHDRLVAFSCKRRGFCPSCGGRRMADTAAHLVGRIPPGVPVRQGVLTLP